MAIWHYRVSKQHEHNQAQMEPQEMLYNIAIAIEAGIDLALNSNNTHRGETWDGDDDGNDQDL